MVRLAISKIKLVYIVGKRPRDVTKSFKKFCREKRGKVKIYPPVFTIKPIFQSYGGAWGMQAIFDWQI